MEAKEQNEFIEKLATLFAQQCSLMSNHVYDNKSVRDGYVEGFAKCAAMYEANIIGLEYKTEHLEAQNKKLVEALKIAAYYVYGHLSDRGCSHSNILMDDDYIIISKALKEATTNPTTELDKEDFICVEVDMGNPKCNTPCPFCQSL